MINNQLFNSLVLVSLAGYAMAQCNDFGRELANYVPDATICMCNSAFNTIDDCAVELVTLSSCADFNASMTTETLQISTGVIPSTAANLTDNTDSVLWTIKIPVQAGRAYTAFSVGNCTDGAELDSYTQYHETCQDVFEFSLPAISMTKCGFSYEQIGTTDTDQYANYTEQITFTYTENTEVAGNTVVRIADVVVPTSILLLSRVQPSTLEINVYSSFELDAALVAQDINPQASASYLTLSYVLSEPYSVMSMAGNIVESASPVTLNTATLCESDGITRGNCDTAANGTVMTPSCVLADYGDNGNINNGCLKQAFIEVVHGQCTLEGEFTITDVVIDCYSDLPEEDCPINQPDAATTIVFSLSSEDFCEGNDASQQIIENAVSTTFHFIDPENRDRDAPEWTLEGQAGDITKPAANTPITAIEWDEFFYGRIDFTGLNVTAVTMRNSEISYDEGSTWSTINTANINVLDSHTFTPATDYVESRTGYTPVCTTFGLCTALQSYYIQYLMDANIDLGGTSDVDPGLGNALPIELRTLIDVSYERDGSYADGYTRRRRRQAAVATEQAGGPVGDGQGPALVSTEGQVIGSSAAAEAHNAANSIQMSSFVMIIGSLIAITMCM